MKKGSFFVNIALGAAIAAAGYFIWQGFDRPSPAGSPSPLPSPAVSATSSPAVSPSPAVKIPAPDLDRPVLISANLSDENARKARMEIQRIVAELKSDADSYDEWVNLGLYRKLIGDYEGARLAWEYAAAIRPGVAVPYNNLANLYVYELKQPAKAEAYYLKAIENDPTTFQWYLVAYEYYRFIVKDEAKARAIAQRGISLDPRDRVEFERLLADIEAQR